MHARVALLVVTMLFAGCLDQPTDTDEPGIHPPPMTEPEPVARTLDLTDCQMIETFIAAPAARIAPLIPDDFTLTTAGDQTLGVLGVNDCTMDDNGTMHRVFLAFQVTPNHPDLNAGDDVNHFYEPEHIVQNGTAFLTLVASLGANVTVSDGMTTTVSLLGSTMRAMIASGVHTMTASQIDTGSQPGAAFGHFREYFPADGGYGYFDATYGAGTGQYGAGTGTVAAAPDSPTHTFVGPEGTGAAVTGHGFTFEAAEVGFIPKPAV